MNCTTYIFGELSSGYTQYPDDSSSINLKGALQHCVAPAQLIIHRDDDLMYYIYAKALENGKYIGFAIVINGYYISRPLALFPIFEQLVENLLEEGVIIHFLSNGSITSSLDKLSQEEETICAALLQLSRSIEEIHSEKPLPPTDFSIAINSSKIYSEETSEQEIAEASYRFGYTIILKEKDYDSIRVNSWKNILKNLTEERKSLALANAQLEQENSRILRQKKQVRNVVILVLVVIACAFGIYALRDSLNNTKEELSSANSTIGELNSTIYNRDSEIADLTNRLEDTNQALLRERANYASLQEETNAFYASHPIIVEDLQVGSTQVKLDFYSHSSANIELSLVCLAERDSERYVDNYSLTSSTGNNSFTLSLSTPLNTTKYYYVLVVYGGRVIAGRRW